MMILLLYVLALALVIIGISFAGLASHKHFIVIMLGIELMLVASTIALVAFFDSNVVQNPGALAMLIGIWAVAAVEIITLVTFYVYMRFRGVDFDVTKLTKMKW